MVDAFRAQLDALMGVNRNGDTVRRALAFDLPRPSVRLTTPCLASINRAAPPTTATSPYVATSWRACARASCL